MTAKRITALILALILTLPLAACGKSKSEWRDDVSAATLSDTVSALIPVEGGYDMSDASFLTYYFEGNTAIDDFAIAASSLSSDVNEYGILHVSDAKQVKEVRKMANDYLTKQRDFLASFISAYSAAEMTKLDEAEVHVYGNYVVYTMLSKEDTAAVLAAVEKALAK